MAIDEKKVLEELSKVQDPELHKDLVSLNMIKNVDIGDDFVNVEVELTTPACPMKDTIKNDIEKTLLAVEGVEKVEVTLGAKVRPDGQKKSDDKLIPEVKNVILVGSGKGGVGKSTVSINIAAALVKEGAKVGLMDADVYGPSIPTMLGSLDTKPFIDQENELIIPLELAGMKVMSIGFLTDQNAPVIWRGPILSGVITQFLQDVKWGELDYLIVDLPPGTGDVQLTLSQKIRATGAVLVTTPQNVALADVYRAKYMFDKVEVPVLGIVENMSAFECPDCGKTYNIFKGGGGEKAAKELQIDLLGKIPIHPDICEACDNGVPAIEAHPETEYAKSFTDIAKKMAGKISVKTINK